MNDFNPVLQYVKAVRDEKDINKIAQMLSTGEWIAICATNSDPPIFTLGKVNLVQVPIAANGIEESAKTEHNGIRERYAHIVRAIGELEQLNKKLASEDAPIPASPQLRENNRQILALIHAIAESEAAWRKMQKTNGTETEEWFG